MAEAAHSKWSASGFEAIILCPGKKTLEAGKPNSTSKYAAEGTVAHQVLTWCLQNGLAAHHYVGSELEADGFKFTVNDDMARHVQVCVDYILEQAGTDGTAEVYVDQRVNYAGYLGVDAAEAWGTLDVAVVHGTTLYVTDFKYGMGVEVSATRNPQLSLYGLGMLASLKDLCDIDKVVLAISQPRIKAAASEWEISVVDLEQWGHTSARSAVTSAINAEQSQDHPEWAETFLRPGQKQCKFCRAKADCSALRGEVAETVFALQPASPDEFEAMPAPGTGAGADPAWLSVALSKVDLIEDWCTAVRAEAERRLLAGEPVPGYKLVQGKRGNRAWSDAAAAEEMLKGMRLKVEEMYELKLISPTSAEKLAPKFDKAGKPVPAKEGAPAPLIGPRQWPKLKALITQSEGKPSVAPSSDPREAIVVGPIDDAFEVLADDIC